MTTRRPSPEQLLTENSELRRQVEQLVAELAHARSHAPPEQSEVDLLEQARRKDRFLAILAHELRNPLAPLLNGLRLLHSARADGTIAHSALEMMDRQLAQLVRLVDDLLDVSRISRDKIELRLHRVALRDIVSAAVETSRPQIDALQHQIQVVLPSEPVLLDADQARLAQVFANLLNNAAKYTPRGGRISLGAALDGPSVVVRVRDDGIGIAPENLARVFDVFVQERHGSGGLGIGLTIVKRLVELHGGQVEARSAGTGRGSEFVVRLPLPPPGPPGPTEPQALVAPVSRVGTNVILIVDDNRDAADSFALLVEDAGYVVHTAYTGEDALVAVEQVDPDVVLLDIGLPGLDGYAVCERIRASDSTPGASPWQPAKFGHERLLVAVTGWGQEEDRRRAVAAGFDEHLVKPVDPDQVLRLVHDWFADRADRR